MFFINDVVKTKKSLNSTANLHKIYEFRAKMLQYIIENRCLFKITLRKNIEYDRLSNSSANISHTGPRRRLRLMEYTEVQELLE